MKSLFSVRTENQNRPHDLAKSTARVAQIVRSTFPIALNFVRACSGSGVLMSASYNSHLFEAITYFSIFAMKKANTLPRHR